MDAYPQDYVNHNLPLVLLSGLEADAEDDSRNGVDYPLLAEKGAKIFSDFPPLSGAVAEELRRVLLEEDGSQMPWRAGTASNGNSPSTHIAYRIRSSGRVSSSPDMNVKRKAPMRSCLVPRMLTSVSLHCSHISFLHAKPILPRPLHRRALGPT
jgi:hypothetical protein